LKNNIKADLKEDICGKDQMITTQDTDQRCPRTKRVAVEKRVNNTTNLHVFRYKRFIIMSKAVMMFFLNWLFSFTLLVYGKFLTLSLLVNPQNLWNVCKLFVSS